MVESTRNLRKDAEGEVSYVTDALEQNVSSMKKRSGLMESGQRLSSVKHQQRFDKKIKFP